MKAHAIAGPAKVLGVHLLLVDAVDQLVAAVGALILDRVLGEVDRVTGGHQVGVEGRGVVGDVDNAGLNRVPKLEWRHGFRPAHDLDLNDALAVLVDPVCKGLELATECGAEVEGRRRAQRDFFGDGRCAQSGCRKHGGTDHGPDVHVFTP